MDEMLSDLLNLARQGDLVGERTAVELEPLVRGVWLDCDLDAATLDVPSSTRFLADRSRVEELFSNLFENTHTHCGDGVTVRVGALAGGRGFYVEDDGDGIPPDEQGTVFEWGHTTDRDGTGFGLAIVEAIVDAHGWQIDVSEAESGGARFEITGLES
jgi:signal transduction histidine kinase